MLRCASRFAARLLLALCLLGSTVQGFVAQTHVHAAPGLAAGASAESPRADALRPPDPVCFLCDVAGHSPAAAPPAAGAVVAAAQLHEGPVAVRPGIPSLTCASHHWLSRGPPPV